MGFINDDDPNENFINEGNIDYSNSTSYEVVEETKISHGMFVATRQVADTFFHKITPSQTIKVQLNPIMENKQSIENKEITLIIPKNQGNSLLRKFKANFIGYMKKPTKTMVNAIVFIFALFLVLCVYLKEQVEDWKPKPEYVKRKNCYEASNSMKRVINWNEQEKIWFIGIKSGKGFDVVLKKIGIFLTISLAICTMWVNHIIASP